MSRRVSLSREIWISIRALDGLEQIADAWTNLPEGHESRRLIPSAMGAVATIVRDRLAMLERVVRNELDPVLIWCVDNDAGAVLNADDDADVHFVEWDGARAVKRAKDELLRTEAAHRYQPGARRARRAPGRKS
jgi:hypothetical protein